MESVNHENRLYMKNLEEEPIWGEVSGFILTYLKFQDKFLWAFYNCERSSPVRD